MLESPFFTLFEETMMDASGQPIGHAYGYYSSGDEGGLVEEYGPGVPYAHGQVQHQYTMQGPSIDMSQMRPQIPMHGTYAMQPQHPSIQPHHVVTHVQPYDQRNINGIYHQPITTPPPPPSPYDPVSPAQSVSDHSASGTESAGAMPVRAGGVPIMPRVYHHHSHSHSSQSSTSSLHGGEHPYAAPIMPYHPTDPNMRRHSKNRSIDRRSVETTPPPGPPGSDDDRDFDRMEPYINQISLLNRKESTRRQRIQAEQRRRDELRDGYARLKEVLPISNSKSSKVSLIERARSHILDMDSQNSVLKKEIERLKSECARLQLISEQMALTVSLAPGGAEGMTRGPPVVVVPHDADDNELGLSTGPANDAANTPATETTTTEHMQEGNTAPATPAN